MSRRPLQSVNTNVVRPAFPIFDDFGPSGKTKTVTRTKEIPAASVAQSQGPRGRSGHALTSKLLVTTIIFQHYERLVLLKKTAFLKLANNSIATTLPSHSRQQVKKVAATPKKRRLENVEDNDEIGDGYQGNAGSLAATTPARPPAHPSTPHTARLKVMRTPQRAVASSTRSLDEEATVHGTSKPNNLTSPRAKADGAPGPTDTLAERLRLVEESLRKLSTATNAATPSKSKPKPSKETASTSSNPEGAAISGSAAESSPHGSTAKPEGSTLYRGTGGSLQAPALTEHAELQQAIRNATRSSLQTLLRGREHQQSAKPASDHRVRDALAACQKDTAKIQATYAQENATPNVSAEAAALRVETAVTHYHHTKSTLSPLSPLGDQAGRRGASTAPVALSQLSLLQEKMGDWRAKYGGGGGGERVGGSAAAKPAAAQSLSGAAASGLNKT